MREEDGARDEVKRRRKVAEYTPVRNGGRMVGMDDETRRLIDASCPDVRERIVHRINFRKKAWYILSEYIEKKKINTRAF